MQNRPANLFHDGESRPGIRDALVLEKHPSLRLAAVFVLMTLPLLLVVGKLLHLQLAHGDSYVTGFGDRVSESFRPIETTDGRILLDGTVVARDIASYELKLHYRWLEEPADGVWLRRKARERVSSEFWRDRARMQAAEQEVLAVRRRMWQRLAAHLNLTMEEFSSRRTRIQQRVERIVALVENKRNQRAAEAADRKQRERAAARAGRGWLESVWQFIREELTTAPRRRQREPVEIREEFDYHTIADGLSLDQIAGIVSRTDLFPGTDYEMVTRREYPLGPLAAHLIGARQPIDADEIAAASVSAGPDPFAPHQTARSGLTIEQQTDLAVTDAALKPGDRVGRSGVEQSYGEHLKGRRGMIRIVRDADGEIIRREVLRQPVKGTDVELTLVKPLQEYAESLLDEALGTPPLLHPSARREQARTSATDPLQSAAELTDSDGQPADEPLSAGRPQGGCIVAINVFTGEILCAAAAPRFDLRLMTDFDEETWNSVTRDPRSPMFPRVTQMAIPPGSVFKTLTTIAGLEDRVIDPDESIFCRGYFKVPTRHRCYVFRHRGYGHGDMTLTGAISHSCNVYFYNVGDRLGPDRLAFWSRRLGFGQRTGIDLPGEAPGHVPEPGTPQAIQLASYRDRQQVSPEQAIWHSGETLNFAIGQSSLAVTPLQIVRLTAAIANGGELVTPHVVRRLNRSHESASARILPRPRQRVPLRPETLQHLRSGMEQVVARGTGRRVRLDEITIAGKTGTAETGPSGDHAWFTGYVPADSPQIAFVVVLEHGGSGGAVAGPLARKLVEKMLDERLVAPDGDLLN